MTLFLSDNSDYRDRHVPHFVPQMTGSFSSCSVASSFPHLILLQLPFVFDIVGRCTTIMSTYFALPTDEVPEPNDAQH